VIVHVKDTKITRIGDLEYHLSVVIDKTGQVLIDKKKYRLRTERVASIDVPYRTLLEHQQVELDKNELVWFLQKVVEWRNGNGTDD